ncbi:SdpI family protein [Fusibacter bizertensis]
MTEKEVNESKIVKIMYSFSPVVLFVLLMPFMMKDVPYHTDLMGNIDSTGNRFIMLCVMSVFSAMFFYLYSSISKKRMLFSLILAVLLLLVTVFLLASVVQMDNLFKGFANYISRSYGNQMSFIVFMMMLLLFITADIIPPNSVFGIRNSVTFKSKDAWGFVHTKAKPVVLGCSLANLYIFLVPNLDNFMKMLLSFATIIVSLVTVTIISQKYKSQLSK